VASGELDPGPSLETPRSAPSAASEDPSGLGGTHDLGSPVHSPLPTEPSARFAVALSFDSPDESADASAPAPSVRLSIPQPANSRQKAKTSATRQESATRGTLRSGSSRRGHLGERIWLAATAMLSILRQTVLIARVAGANPHELTAESAGFESSGAC